jgi:hypothetical protein
MILCALALATPFYVFGAPAWFNRAVVAARYVQISDDVYADPGMAVADRRRALEDLQSARDRIATLYGAPRAKPVTILAASDGEAARLGLRDGVPGSAFITPVDTRLVLNMAHFSVDVMAHELTHAELADRLGFWTRMTRLPVWFDEGVALQLDWRHGYLVDCAAVGAQRIRKVQTLDRAGQFWDGDQGRIVANYRAAKCAAAQVLERHPAHSLYDSLARLHDGESFADVFPSGD